MYLDYTPTKKKNHFRHVKIINYFNSNFLTHYGLAQNTRLNKSLSFKKRLIKRCYFKKNYKLSGKNYIYWKYNALLITRPYRILTTKKVQKSSAYVGLIKMDLSYGSVKNCYKKKINTWITNYKKNKIKELASSLAFIKLFDGFCILRRRYNYFNHVTLGYDRQIGAGTFMLLSSYRLGYSIYCVKSSILKTLYATSAGSFCILISQDFQNSTCMIRLPSEKCVYVSLHDSCIIGRVSNVFAKHQVLGKASNRFFLKNKKVTVRGVAKNPVDHPNGGRCKVKKPFKNVWGAVAKNGK